MFLNTPNYKIVSCSLHLAARGGAKARGALAPLYPLIILKCNVKLFKSTFSK